ncbi:MAG TPA: hypothetical protein VF469_29965 [Kofleriaceae bacterium]
MTYGAGASGGHPPPLPPGATVSKWDHFCGIVVGQAAEVTRFLDEASDAGWELVGWSIAQNGSNLACFKRPRMISPPPAGAPAAGAAAPATAGAGG